MSDIAKVDARWIERSYRKDTQLHLPAFPRLIPEILVVPYETDAFLFYGTETIQVIRGRSARSLLPRILPLLDGRRTIEQVLEISKESSVIAVLSLLHSRGLLEDGSSDEGPDLVSKEIQSFLGRHVDVTRSYQNRELAVRRLKTALVRVIGPDSLIQPLSEILQASGVGIENSANKLHKSDPPTLTIQFAIGRRSVHPCPPDTLSVVLGRNTAHIGPVHAARVTACPSCLEKMHPSPQGDPGPLFTELVVNQVALRVFNTISKLAPTPAPSSVQAITLSAFDELNEEQLIAPPCPGCLACAIGTRHKEWDKPEQIAWIYHSTTALHTSDLENHKSHQAHYAMSNIRLAEKGAPSVRGSRSAALPKQFPLLQASLSSLDQAKENYSKTITKEILASLLFYTAGELEHKGQFRRVVPTGGNLGSVELWVIALNVDGLEVGTYHYSPRTHTLEKFDRTGGLNFGDLLSSFSSSSSAPDCLIVATGLLGKCALKYGPFAYRLIHYDSGVALTYLQIAAAANDIGIVEFPNFNDNELSRILCLGNKWESPMPTFVVGLGCRSIPGDSTGSHTSIELTEDDKLIDAAPLPIASTELGQHSLYRLIVDSSRVPTRNMPFWEMEGIPPPRAPQILEAVDAIVRTRRSVRAFSAKGIAHQVLRWLGYSVFARQRRRQHAAGQSYLVTPLLGVALDSDEYNTGLYLWECEKQDWVRVACFGFKELGQCVTQSSLALAPATLFFVGNMEQALEIRGARAYRELAQQAGSCVAQVWLEATACGLGGTIAGSVISEGISNLYDVDGYTKCPLLAFHFGYPTSDPNETKT